MKDDALTGRPLTVFCEGPFNATPEHGALLTEPIDHIAVWTATLATLRPMAEAYLASLDPAEKERMARFRFEVDRERFLLGHGWLREVLGTYLQCSSESIVYRRGRFGKPFLEGHPLRFNISDTKDAVAIAISKEREVGVDIETTSRRVHHVEVGQHYFTPEEIAAIDEAPDGKRRFLEFWTRKEAVLKASGVGIMDDLHLLRVNAPMNELRITHPEFIAMASDEYHVRTWAVGDEHLISLAVESAVGEVRMFGV